MKEIIIIALIVAASLAFKYYKIKNSSKARNENESNEDARKRKLYRIISISVSAITVLFIAGLLYYAARIQAKVTIDKNNISVSAGLFENCQYKTQDIKDVTLRDSVPSSSKIVGTGMGDIKRGTFNVEGLGKGHLYLESANGPFLYVILKDSFIIINYKDPKKTKGLYEIIYNYKK